MEKSTSNHGKSVLFRAILAIMLAFMLFVTTAGSAFAAGYSTQTKTVSNSPLYFSFKLRYYSYIENNGVKMVSSYSNPSFTVTMSSSYALLRMSASGPFRIDGGRTYEMGNTCEYIYIASGARGIKSAYVDFYYVN